MSRTVPDWLLARASAAPDAPAMSDPDVTWTAVNLAAVAGSFAAHLTAAGAGQGARVAVLVGDGAPTVALGHAVRLLGAVLVPLNRRAAPAELAYQLATVGPAVLVHDTERAAAAHVALDGQPAPVLRDLAELVGAAPERDDRMGGPILRADVDLDAPAAILFTSGTTGRPKGAVLTHGALAASADAWAAVLEPRPTDRWLACLPLHHVAGLSMAVRAGRWGVALEVHPRFDPTRVDAALDAGVSHISLVPATLEQLLDARAARAAGPVPATLRAVLLGGAPIPPALVRRALDAGFPIRPTYGLTETGSGVSVAGPGDAAGHPGSSGVALPGAEIRTGADGEILVRGSMVFAGYVDDASATEAVLRDGWLHTGDVGVLDDDGRLTVFDRRDDLFVSGGENVYPAEIEAVLCAHPAVADAAVVGRADPRWGAVPVAAVVLRTGASASDGELSAHCRAQLGGYKVPTAFHRLAALPRTGGGKLLRSAVRDLLAGRSA